MFDRRDHDRQTNFVHENTVKVDGGHTVRSKGVRRNCVCAVLEASSKKEEDGNQTGLNNKCRLKKETTKDGIQESEGTCKLSVLDGSDVEICNYVETTTSVDAYVVRMPRFTAALALRSNRCDAGM